MPIISTSNYKAPFPFQNNHFNTAFPTLFRGIPNFTYERERFETPDDDFIDLDWSKVGGENLVLVVHGLEGNSDSVYIKGMIQAFNSAGWDGVGLNFRGCSGTPNRKLISYHMGASADVKMVVNHLESSKCYKKIVLIGFSLGGNVILKYLGEEGAEITDFVDRAITFSVPCYIPDANEELKKWYNKIYLHRFMKALNEKLKRKVELFPEEIKLLEGRLPRTFAEFDSLYTGPIHGYADAEDYWERASSIHFLPDIAVPTLLVNAKDDSFLGESCYPYEIAKKHHFLHLETPENGGHVGFVSFEEKELYWSEVRALEFVGDKVRAI